MHQSSKSQHQNEPPQINNMWTFLEPSLVKYKKRTAWVCREGRKQKRKVTYREISRAALANAALLRSEGVGPGDVVGVTAPNGPEWVVAALAIWKLGAVVAPIHIGNSAAEIQSQVEAINPKAMLGFGTTQLTDNQHLISLEADTEVIRVEREIPVPDEPDKEALLIYTSGSTGQPKVVRLSHRNIGTNVLVAKRLVVIDSGDRLISLLPLSHAMGITTTFTLPTYYGAMVVVPRMVAANEILATIEEEKISIVVAVPRLFRNIMLGLEKKFNAGSKGLQTYISLLRKMPLWLRRRLNAPIRKKLGGNINCWVSGGSHLDGKIVEYYHQLGIPLRQGYGLTETSPILCGQEEFDPAIDSVGRPVSWCEVKLTDVDDQGRGELWVRGSNVMLGYMDEAQTAEVMDNGWFKTGDLARIDGEGRVTLTGRSKRLIVTDAGKNVYPEELETLLERDPRLLEAGVFELKMKPAVVFAMEGDSPEETARDVLKGFNNFVSSHNQITRFAVVEELPRTPLGKIALPELPKMFAKHEVTAKTERKRR